jgi:hypothetical protein
VVEQCITGKRPISHAKTMNVALVGTRLLGTLLALVLLPVMAQYVLVSAHWVNDALSGHKAHELGQATCKADGLEYVLKLLQSREGGIELQLRVNNPSKVVRTIAYSSGAKYDFILRQGDKVLWQARTGTRAIQAIQTEDLQPHETKRFEAKLTVADLAGYDPQQPVAVEGIHLLLHPVQLEFAVSPAQPPTGGGSLP